MTRVSVRLAVFVCVVSLSIFLVRVCTAQENPSAPIEFPGLGPAGNLVSVEIESAGDPLLRGADARRQLVVTGKYSSGQVHDLTHQSQYTASNGNVKVDKDGFVTPLADGEVVVTANAPEGKSATITLKIESFNELIPINFPNQIVPLFTKLGCNTGGCHGKSDGQNGFKLSLLGFYPKEDYEFIVKENRGRRVFPAAPEFSLLLQKPANQLPHGGGHRIDPDSYEWQLISRWIEQGMPYGSKDDPTISSIEVFPKTRAMNRDSRQQLTVVAHYSDGTVSDVTRMAAYESNETEMAESTTGGLVSVFDVPGDVAVMVRFQGQVTVFRANIPLGLPVNNLPPAKNFIDELVFGKLKALGIPPSPLCDDSTFIRRVSVDVSGKLPTADESRQFIADQDPLKRDKLIDRLLESPGYSDYFANKWASVLRNKRVNANDIPFTFRFHDWIRRAFQENMPYDQFARNIIASSGEVELQPSVAWYKNVSSATEQMEDTAQLFLGLRIQCARCHHHPFERWSQDDYYGFQAFFSRVGRKPGRKGVANERVFHNVGLATARNPRTEQDLKPAGLGDEPLEIAPYDDPRQKLVDWMTAPENPFFSRALVNRYWKHFFGRGIVDPEDDMRVTNPPSNPELLDALAKHFVDRNFDLKDLVRNICQSNVYQLSSEPTEYNRSDKQNFSSFYPRRLNAEPLYDAINQVAGTNVNFAGMPVGTHAVELPDNGFNDYFLSVFGKPAAESACECERSAEANLAQSLHLLNSTDIQGKLANGNGRAAMLSKNEEMTDADRITELYYWSFSRPPREDEMKLISTFVENATNKQQAYEDLLWAIFNTKEFLFNR